MNNSPLLTALLPMKGHSERVPNKNLRDFCGRPLFHHILSQLLDSPRIDLVAIDTDSEAIAKSAQSFPRVQIIERPEKLRGDYVPMNEIIDHDLSVLDGQVFLQTHSTNPLLSEKTITQAIDTFFTQKADHDSLFGVTRLQTRLYNDSGQPLNHDPTKLLRTQDLEPVWEENSNLYIFSKESFAAARGNRIGLHPYLFEIEALEAIDIDEEHDLLLATALLQSTKK